VAGTSDLLQAVLGLAWSHWVGLGVRGTARPPNTAVDPEALIYFSACLFEHDPRLREEVADWWIRFQRHVSRPRLTALASRFGEPAISEYRAFEASLADGTLRERGKARLDHLRTEARALLRLRCVFGASARAEIILELFAHHARTDAGLTALALSEVGYSKRNIAFVLDDLALAGMLSSAKEGNRVRYRLTDPAAMERLLRPLPASPGRWHLRLPVLAAFVELARRLRGRDEAVQGIEARKTLERVMPQIVAAGVTAPGPTASADTYWSALQSWIIEHLIVEPSDPGRSIPEMIEGVWVHGSNDIPARSPQVSNAVLPRLSADPVHDHELRCLDLVQVPTVEPHGDWMWMVLSTLATGTYAHSEGLRDREPWRFVTWAFGDRREYAVELDEPVPYDRIASLFGSTAAARARANAPAVQLRLRRLRERS
jgi:DNA-binding transcriptional ArsR family regulator